MYDVQFNVMHVFAVYVLYVCKEVCMIPCVFICDICTVCMYVCM